MIIASILQNKNLGVGRSTERVDVYLGSILIVQHPPPSITSRLSFDRLDNMFGDAFSGDHQMVKGEPKLGTYLACALVTRGAVDLSDVRRNIDR